MGFGPLVVFVVHFDSVSTGRRHRLPVKATMLDIRKFDFNRSQPRRLDGGRLLDYIYFPVQAFTIHMVSPSRRLACILAPIAAALTR